MSVILSETTKFKDGKTEKKELKFGTLSKLINAVKDATNLSNEDICELRNKKFLKINYEDGITTTLEIHQSLILMKEDLNQETEQKKIIV